MKAEAASQRAEQAKARLSGIQTRLGVVKDKLRRQQADIAVRQATIADIARATYTSGGIDPTLQVLLASDPAEFLAQAAVLGQVQQNQVDQLRGMRTSKLRIAQTQSEVADQEAQAEAAKNDVVAAQNEVDQQLAAAQDVLAGLREEERQRLLALQRQQRQEAIAAAQAAAAQAAAFAASDDSGSGDGSAESGGGFSGGTRAQVAIQYALAQVGDPYSYSANPPSSWDCSKLTAAAWAQAGVGLTAISYSQWDQTTRVPVSDIQPGDLVFYFGSGAHHVGMYIGNGKMVHAANPGEGVRIDDFLGPWYGSRFSGVGRVVG
jgi:cell wall-associated NlpC family hydrolase